MFEAVEQARVEAIGARRMAGVAKNLTAMLDDHFHRGKFDEITDRADAPLADALAMMVRERLTGLAPPQAAKKLVDLWRPFIEDKIARAARPARARHRGSAQVRRRAARPARRARARRRPQRRSEDDEDQDENQDGEQDQSGAEGQPDGDAQQDMSMEQAEASADEMPPKAPRKARSPRPATRSTTARWATTRRPATPRARRCAAATSRAGRSITPSRRNSTRWSPPKTSAIRKSWSGCAPISTSSSRICRASSRASPTACSAG